MAFALALTMGLSSCSDWLDVEPVSEEREQDQFSSYQGFKDALTGCYTALTSRSLYGDKLTMSDIDELACLWTEPFQQQQPERYYMYHHDYTTSTSENAIKQIYGGLFNVVAQANKVIEHVESDGSTIKSTDSRNVVTGEAYALRALCQMDVLRLFGQMPQNAQRQVRLPYSLKTGIDETASYYSYTDYVAMLEGDLNKAESLLQESDPVNAWTFTQLDQYGGNVASLDDSYLLYRRFRLNLLAVKALKARMYLYTGQKQKAYSEAMAVINHKVNGEPTVSLSGVGDIANGFYALPDECVFALSVNSLSDYAFTLTHSTPYVDANNQLYVTTDMLDKQLFLGANTASDNRYLNIWDKTSATSQGQVRPSIRKYFFDVNSANATNLMYRHQIVPMIRMSELYLIAMETAPSLTDASALYKTLMASHNVNITTEFASDSELQEEVLKQYQREFYGEGQMFYTYKRLGATSMLFSTEEMGDDQYILPLPLSEYDPSLQN